MNRAAGDAEGEALVRLALLQTRTIAVIGASAKRWRAAFDVMSFMQARGYRALPVNPTAVGQLILGERVMSGLAEADGPVELVSVFRNSAAAGEAIEAAITERQRLGIRFVWLQPGIEAPAAVRHARAEGLAVIVGRCLKVDYLHRFGVAPRETVAAG